MAILGNNDELTSDCPSERPVFKGHLPHQRAALVTSSGVRPFIPVAQDCKRYRFKKNYLQTPSAAQSSFEGLPQMYTHFLKKKKKSLSVKLTANSIWWVYFSIILHGYVNFSSPEWIMKIIQYNCLSSCSSSWNIKLSHNSGNSPGREKKMFCTCLRMYLVIIHHYLDSTSD